MKARPTKAGLKRLRPNPPKTCLPKTIPTTAPTAAIQSGIVGGSDNPKSIAVTNAAEVTGSFRWRTNTHSAKNAKTKVVARTATLRQPNR